MNFSSDDNAVSPILITKLSLTLAGDARAENHPEDNPAPHLSDDGPTAAPDAGSDSVRRDLAVRPARVQVQAAGAPLRHLRQREAAAALLRHRSVPGRPQEQGRRRGRLSAAAAAAGRHACGHGARPFKVAGGDEEGQQRLSPLAPLQRARPPAVASTLGQQRPRGDGQAHDGGVERGDIEATTGEADGPDAHHPLQVHHKRRNVRRGRAALSRHGHVDFGDSPLVCDRGGETRKIDLDLSNNDDYDDYDHHHNNYYYYDNNYDNNINNYNYDHNNYHCPSHNHHCPYNDTYNDKSNRSRTTCNFQ